MYFLRFAFCSISSLLVYLLLYDVQPYMCHLIMASSTEWELFGVSLLLLLLFLLCLSVVAELNAKHIKVYYTFFIIYTRCYLDNGYITTKCNLNK